MQHSIQINKTAHYHTLGDVNTAETIWFVLHGYGYAAEHFIKKFEPILTDKTFIVAPEGLSKFYLNGVEGRIGASWMTKENREEEITDYINYLNLLYDNITKENPNAKINILGFSQGGATASRWIANGELKCDNFILWCSVFPDDMQFESISNTNTYFLYGDNDQYVTEERVSKQQELINNSELEIKTIVFEGKHDIPKNALLEQVEINSWR